jgi:hypothetical protein
MTHLPPPWSRDYPGNTQPPTVPTPVWRPDLALAVLSGGLGQIQPPTSPPVTVTPAGKRLALGLWGKP